MDRITSNNSPSVVVVALNDASLSIIRSLGRRGLRLIGICDEHTEVCYLRSRYLSSFVKSQLHGEQLIETLLRLTNNKQTEKPVLFCASDLSVLTVSLHREELEKVYRLVIPSHEVASRQISKKGIHSFALQNSFNVPESHFTASQSDIEEAAARLTYPCIVKPEFRDDFWNARVPVKVFSVGSRQELFYRVKEYGIQTCSLIIQEWIDGGDAEVYFCLAYLGRDGRPLAACTARKLRQHPHLTGSTSIAETVDLPELADESLRYLTTAGCVGFCSVEYKRCPHSGKFYVTEPTIGRPDTQEGVFLSAGLDVPYVAYLDACGEKVEPLGVLARQITWINEPLAFYTFQEFLRTGQGGKAFRELCRGKRSYALWSSDDPRPAASFLWKKISHVGRKFFRSEGTN